MNKSFLLVGGSSDIARHLAAMLLDDGHHVTLLARDGDRVSELVGRGAHFVEGDALDETIVQAAVAHAAGLSEDESSTVEIAILPSPINFPFTLSANSLREIKC